MQKTLIKPSKQVLMTLFVWVLDSTLNTLEAFLFTREAPSSSSPSRKQGSSPELTILAAVVLVGGEGGVPEHQRAQPHP